MANVGDEAAEAGRQGARSWRQGRTTRPDHELEFYFKDSIKIMKDNRQDLLFLGEWILEFKHGTVRLFQSRFDL